MDAFFFFFFLSPSSSSLFSLFILTVFQVCCASHDIHFTSCAPFDCGTIRNISYPFWTDDLRRPSYCGYGDEEYKLECMRNEPPVLTLSSQQFRVLNLNASFGLLTIQRVNLSTCPGEILITSAFNYTFSAENITLLYGCDRFRGLHSNHSFSCTSDGREEFPVLFEDEENGCDDNGEKVVIPVGKEAFDDLINGTTAVNETLLQPFNMRYFAYEVYCKKCKDSGGSCGSNETVPAAFACYCRDHPRQIHCHHGFGAAAGGIIISSIAFYFWLRRHRGKNSFNSSYDSSFMMDPEKSNSLAGVQLFTYKELEQATNNFDSNKELGDGGFGTVYHGKLRDGRAVAVKRLYESNYKRVEQFMNEVSILTRLRHRNLVLLYGCTSRHSRELLLVYEYVPNGTVADHLHGQRAKSGALSWFIRLDIAIETANALTYLHASDTIHRDVKTNNILLDGNFTVKVADFGLSRLFPTNVTHVSTAPQGTPGYVDPEYHQCYQLTNKSDVFSFGVVLIELISSKPAVDITRHRQEINLSNLAINKIKNQALHELVDPSLGFESGYKVRKTITGVAEVAFQCLQSERDMRPTMAQVLDALLRIQSEDYSKSKEEEIDISGDDVVLLKSGPLPHSPDCVMVKWPSSSTTQSSTS
ncbi:LEAF RUST 10 DISEASE-RESISTANCE LOCUS RECEPTOR-LIKE PROTEIN KINASE-like 1.2 isoform X2 [Hibiscus syriacus]|uniref:LEAF RUST 10 DISEASE-RESISTANCE LOCUS RECEPTOR-LIKE PROTEIN KINASE-like 1.2 isoform X2 n=1 Tax=Hibiscus syriacus TaxID=106335 RepID=UPI0019233C57|nr:LEAF RUST 10 DISEASE-RESISTANCE LOCUS RECEPTOR-LIKE PROTEIN KINASE-like 1.2 isoform X2 [Hibiscus syriacus]